MSRPNPVFTDVVWNDVPKSWFDHSHKWEGTTDFSKLIPIYWDYFRPGDVIKGNVSIFGRSLPLKQPVYGDAYMHVDWFAVPLRLIWKNFAEFIQGTNNKGVPVSHELPYIRCSGEASTQPLNCNGSLVDYLGGLTCWYDTDSEGVTIYSSESRTNGVFRYDALPFRAYNAIWNEYFRDEQLQDVIDFSEDDGLDTYTEASCSYILPVCAEKDRFTTARPNPQLGDAVNIPTQNIVSSDSVSFVAGQKGVSVVANDDQTLANNFIFANGGVKFSVESSIADLRTAVALQHLLETRNVGGFRYFEQVLSDFGVKMSDIRAQRPEFIGGDTIPFMINSVTQSSSDTDSSYLGEQAGQGMFSKDTDNIYYEANEDVIVMAVMFVRPRAFYFQNVRKQFVSGLASHPPVTSWMDKFYNPKLQGLGDEPVFNYEVAIGTNDDENSTRPLDGIFGYTSQYSMWKCHANEVHGAFKDSLRSWIYARDLVVRSGSAESGQYHGCDLTDLVQLDASDYRDIYAYNRVKWDENWNNLWNNFSVNDHLLMDLSFGLEVRRSLEFYGTPGIGVI